MFSTDSLKHANNGTTVEDELIGGNSWTWNNTNFPIYSQFDLTSPIYAGSKVAHFVGDNDYLSLASGSTTHINPGTGGTVTLAVIFRSDDVTLDWRGFFNKDITASQKVFWGGQNAANGTMRFGYFLDNATESSINPASFWVNDTWYYIVCVINTVPRAQVYKNGVFVIESSTLASGLPTGTSEAWIGRSGVGYTAGYIAQIIVADTSWGLKQAKELGNLAWNWKSGGGAVVKGAGFNQGISGGGLTVKAKGSGGFSYTPTLTGDSTRFTYQTVSTTFSGDSLLLETDTDSVWTALPDTVLASTLGLQVVFDSWETGGVVYVDNITVSGYTLPVSTTTGKSRDRHKQFKNFIVR